MAFLLVCIGAIIAFVGMIMFYVAAFRESVLWGLGCLVFSPVCFIFLILHFDEAAKPFFIQLGGAALVFLGLFMGN